ncbi:hypothetical protein BA950_10630 [Erythrobacter sp. SAORIC-644]|uniref:hypothetical protein n=1 Tax=Erythrobacter sp. SAORIC-644 TaxID=1869314 RepID=UPI000C9F2C16|nr:hypothetical protein [Erythrobacter sp. SAORIC-644]PNQ76235.1 hypothetical protein BA950_10630 [Erythrobacter sp. SAORIC-644]
MLSLSDLANNWTVTFVGGLAVLFFVVKLLINRRITPIDCLGGVAELPSDIAAACVSLAAAYLWLASADTKIGSIGAVLFCAAFVVTTALYRYVDDEKMEFGTKPIRLTLALIVSYLTLYFLSIQPIFELYAGLGKGANG